MLKLYHYKYIDMTSAEIDEDTEASDSIESINRRLIRRGKKIVQIKEIGSNDNRHQG